MSAQVREHRSEERARSGADRGSEPTTSSDLTVLPVTVEHHRESFGIGETTPRLSWVARTELPDWRQAAYELEIEPLDGPAWSSGRIESAESVLVPWGAPALTSRERRSVRVRVWGVGAAEPSAWSEDAVVRLSVEYLAEALR